MPEHNHNHSLEHNRNHSPEHNHNHSLEHNRNHSPEQNPNHSPEHNRTSHSRNSPNCEHNHQHPRVPIVLYATAEATDAAYLHQATGYQVVTSARELSAVEHRQFIVVPMCTGRDLMSITQAAQSLRWLNARSEAMLADPALNHTYTIARLRDHLRKLAMSHDAVLFVSAAVDPFADAELFRRVRLAQQFSESVRVAVAFDDPSRRGVDCWPQVQQALAQLDVLCRFSAEGALTAGVAQRRGGGVAQRRDGGVAGAVRGASGDAVREGADMASSLRPRIAIVRADLHPAQPIGLSREQGTGDRGGALEDSAVCSIRELMPATALRAAVEAAARRAEHAWAHGDDGIAAGLMADHGQGFAHSHRDDDHTHSHSRPHDHAHAHSHSHPHDHAQGHPHPHSHSHPHDHAHPHSHSHLHDHVQGHPHPHDHTHND